MKKYYLLFALLFISNISFTQTYQWVKHNTINLTSSPDNALFPSSTDASGNIITGSLNLTAPSTNYYGNIILRKFNNAGTQVISKLMTGKAIISGIETDGSDNIYFWGLFMDTLTIEPGNIILNTGSGFNLNTFLVKLNSSGGFVWKKNITAIYGNSAVLSRLKVKNNFIIAGIDISFQSSMIKKFDLGGNEMQSISQLSTKVLGSVDADVNGNIYAAGSCSQGNITFGNVTLNCPYVYSLYFAKYNSSGTNIYAKFVEDVTFESPNIICDASGNAYAAGELNDDFIFGSIHTQGPQWVYDFYLTKIDPSGNFLWVKEVPNSGPITGDAAIGKLSSIEIDGQNNIYLTGFQRGTVNWGGITTTTPIKGSLVLKFSTSGSLLFAKVTSGTGGGRGDALSIDNSGNIFISGNLSNTVNFDTITVAGVGEVNSFISKLTNPLTAIQNQNGVALGYSLSNYPNPFNPVTTINFSIANSSHVNLTVFDITGKKITELVNEKMDAGNYSREFNAEKLSSGIYFYTIESEVFRETKKMILLK